VKNQLQYVHSLDEIQLDNVERHGGKAVNLAKLSHMGFIVPQSISISCDVFVQMMKDHPKLMQLIDDADSTDDFEELLQISERLQKIIDEYAFPENLKAEINKGIENLQKLTENNEIGFAIRSSATIEDRSDISFAGQAESYLCVNTTDGILDSVKKVFRSAFSECALVYLKTKNIPLRQVKMAVLIQEMISADISGVMFTVNVVNNNTEEMLINATWGLGDCLVSGKVVPDTYILAKSPLQVIQQELGEKEVTSRPDTNQVILSETPKDKRLEYSLNDSMLHDVAEVGMKIESGMESPQDIEWCIRSDGSLVVLQTRPITTLKSPSSDEA